jgi:hypothetical protein
VPIADIAGPPEDVNHPIPRLDTFDTVLTTERGAYLGLVIATPLRDDSISRARLHRKVGMYLQYFRSQEYQERCGAPLPDRSRIYVSVHPASDPSMLKLIEDYTSNMPEQGITPVLKFSDAS